MQLSASVQLNFNLQLREGAIKNLCVLVVKEKPFMPDIRKRSCGFVLFVLNNSSEIFYRSKAIRTDKYYNANQ